MGYDYALVHLKYTIPPAVALTTLYRPLLTRLDIYKIIFLVTVAVLATTPWDSYLVRTKIWTYPPSAVLGVTIFSIPIEEVFFFIIQTYNTSLLYLLLSKPTFHPPYLWANRAHSHENKEFEKLQLQKSCGQAIILATIFLGSYLVWAGAQGLYLGLILVWAAPVILFLWSLSYQFLIGLPWLNTVVPIALPTIYLWIVDTLALKKGTWVIQSGTKLGSHLWDGLELEEAVFFLVSNTVIVFGLVTCDYSLTILHTFVDIFPRVPKWPSLGLITQALLIPETAYDVPRLEGISQAVSRLQRKSRSFYLASGVFEGRLRHDLILLYAFCRVADDLIDEALTLSEAREWLKRLHHFVKARYAGGMSPELARYIRKEFPDWARSALLLLPATHLSSPPLIDLLRGFETDLDFFEREQYPKVLGWPIAMEHDLEIYASRVASTVAELCIELVYHHSSLTVASKDRERIIACGRRMGIALQYINIARDIAVDAHIGRVYLPEIWLKEEGLVSEDVIKNPQGPVIERLRERMLGKAMLMYRESRDAIEELPSEARGPMRVAIESYVEIGRVLGEKDYKVKAGKATVPKMRRLFVAWKALNGTKRI